MVILKLRSLFDFNITILSLKTKIMPISARMLKIRSNSIRITGRGLYTCMREEIVIIYVDLWNINCRRLGFIANTGA